MKVLFLYLGKQEISPLIVRFNNSGIKVDLVELDFGNQNIQETLDKVISSEYDLIFRADSDSLTEIVSNLMQHSRICSITADTAAMISDKEKYCRLFQRLQIPTPKIYQVFDQETDINQLDKNIGFPCIAKPIQGSASIGIRILNNMTNLKLFLLNKIDRQYVGGRYLLQEYISGDVCSVAGHVYQGKISIDFLIDIHSDCYPYAAETGFNIPSKHRGTVEDQVFGFLDIFFKEIGLTDSPFMLDFIVDDKGDIYLIDFGARLSKNDLLFRCYEETDYIYKLIRKLTTGEEFEVDRTISLSYSTEDGKNARIDSDVVSKGIFRKELTGQFSSCINKRQ